MDGEYGRLINETDYRESCIADLIEVEGLERPLAEKLIAWGIYTRGDFYRRPSSYLADILEMDQGTISRLQVKARLVMVQKGEGFD